MLIVLVSTLELCLNTVIFKVIFMILQSFCH